MLWRGLGALILAGDNRSRGKMRQPHGGVGFVHMLATGAGGTVGVNANVGFLDVDGNFIADFRNHIARSEGRVPPGIGIEG